MLSTAGARYLNHHIFNIVPFKAPWNLEGVAGAERMYVPRLFSGAGSSSRALVTRRSGNT